MGIEIATKDDLGAFQANLKVDLAEVIRTQQEILVRLDRLEKERTIPMPINSGYMPALEYMRAVGIKRWKFDQLIAGNKIRAIKKKKKIYVPVGEVERYFRDPNIR